MNWDELDGHQERVLNQIKQTGLSLKNHVHLSSPCF